MRQVINALLLTGFVLIFAGSFTNAQTTPSPVKPEIKTADYALLIENEDGKQTKLSVADLAKIKRQTVKVNDHGEEATFEGFPLIEALKLAGIEFGESLRGKRLATFLLVEAADKYQAIFALPELEPAFSDKLVLLADKRDGKALPEKEGTFRIVVPDEKKQGRWVRQVTALKILRAPGLSK